MFLPMLASAHEYYNGVYYEMKPDGTYKVVKHPSGKYSGEITISSLVNGLKVTEIGDLAFYETEVTNVHIPLTIERIGENALCGCLKLESIEIPESVKEIGPVAFGANPYLKDVYCYAKDIIMGYSVFYKLTDVKKITLHVPEANLQYFKKADQWKKIKTIVTTTSKGWAVEQQEREIAEQKRIAEEKAKAEAKARQDLINDRTLAEQGNSGAQLRMAKRYEKGDGVTKDINKAVELCKKAVDQGNAEAQVCYGDYLMHGVVIVDNGLKNAIDLYRCAAESGNADGQYKLGVIYCRGEYIRRDDKIGMEWINKAAAQGHELAKKYQETYIENHKSYWNSTMDWRAVFQNGQMVGHSPSENKESTLYTNDFYILGADYYCYNNSYHLDEILNEGKKIKLRTYDPAIAPKNLYVFNTLSAQEKTKMLKENLGVFEMASFIKIKSTPDDGFNNSDKDVIGYYSSGKFQTNAGFEAEIAEAQKEVDKAVNAKMAYFAKRLGINPKGITYSEFIASGRSFSAVKEYCAYLKKDPNATSFDFVLSKDHGSSKGYKMFINSKQVGFIWVRGDKISSVNWY